MMDDMELDRAYTDFCHQLGKAGEQGALKALSRFALLAMLEIGDPEKIGSMIRQAVEDDKGPASPTPQEHEAFKPS
jgi:hypothetical protein